MSENDRNSLEGILRSNRPRPRDEYVESMTRRLGHSRRPSTGYRALVVGALTAFLLAALAASGGLTGASAGVSGLGSTAKKIVAPGEKGVKLGLVKKSPANDQYREKCNSGRGNGSEGDDSQLLVPGSDTGPGIFPTVDCDPGNSGDKNRGGD